MGCSQSRPCRPQEPCKVSLAPAATRGCFVSVVHRRSRPPGDETVAPISRSAVVWASSPALLQTDQDCSFQVLCNTACLQYSDRANQLRRAHLQVLLPQVSLDVRNSIHPRPKSVTSCCGSNVRCNCRVCHFDPENTGARSETVLTAPLPVDQGNYCLSVHSERWVSLMPMFTRSKQLTCIGALCAITCLVTAGASSTCQQPSNAPVIQGEAPAPMAFDNVMFHPDTTEDNGEGFLWWSGPKYWMFSNVS